MEVKESIQKPFLIAGARTHENQEKFVLYAPNSRNNGTDANTLTLARRDKWLSLIESREIKCSKGI